VEGSPNKNACIFGLIFKSCFQVKDISRPQIPERKEKKRPTLPHFLSPLGDKVEKLKGSV